MSFSDYKSTTVLEAINILHEAVNQNYYRDGLTITLEPYSFHRLEEELKKMVVSKNFNIGVNGEIVINTQFGSVFVKKDYHLKNREI